ncbi:MAG: NTP transferase domain-containing protein [Haloferacaceae archaeon]
MSDDADESTDGHPTDPDLPVVEAASPEEPVEAGVHGVLLAAGTSSRFGAANKLLATEAGEPIVRRAARALLDSRVRSVTVVTGHEADRVRDALAGLDVRIVHASDYAAGQSRSVRRGIEAVRTAFPDADAVVVALGDMPDVSAATIDRLLAAYEAGAGSALAAAYEGVRGNPVLFDARHFDALVGVDGDVGGRGVLRSAPDAALVETGDPGVRRDVDRPGDLRE